MLVGRLLCTATLRARNSLQSWPTVAVTRSFKSSNRFTSSRFLLVLGNGSILIFFICPSHCFRAMAILADDIVCSFFSAFGVGFFRDGFGAVAVGRIRSRVAGFTSNSIMPSFRARTTRNCTAILWSPFPILASNEHSLHKKLAQSLHPSGGY